MPKFLFVIASKIIVQFIILRGRVEKMKTGSVKLFNPVIETNRT